MKTNNGMEELGYIDTGLYESFLYDGLEKNYGVENVDILNKVDNSGGNGLFAELGFSEEIPAPGWSLVEQLGWTPNVDTPSLEDIIDEACSPLSTVSGIGDTSFQDDLCLQSPLSDSGISCNSSNTNVELEELDTGTWEPNQLAGEIDWSAFQLLTEAQQELEENEASSHVLETLPQESESLPVEITQDSYLAPKVVAPENATPEEIVFDKEVHNDAIVSHIGVPVPVQNIEPAPKPVPPVVAKNQKIFIVKAIPVRQAPYTKSKPEKKQRSKEQKERKKNQNRDAALRYRNKKKEELDQLFDEAATIEKANKELNEKVTELTKEIDYLKSLMLDVIKAKLARSKAENS